MREVHRAQLGDHLRVGELGGKIGHAQVDVVDDDRVELEVDAQGLATDPPPSLPVTLCVALSRPPTVAKVLTQATAMGIKHFAWFHARRVEKSYWQSSALTPEAIDRQLRLGLEQAVDTVCPAVELCPRFVPFVEDRLPNLLAARGVPTPTVAHPGRVGGAGLAEPCVLVVGPEGGFIDYELERFEAIGANFVDLGPRILRVETAVVALVAQLAASGRAVG